MECCENIIPFRLFRNSVKNFVRAKHKSNGYKILSYILCFIKATFSFLTTVHES